MEKALYVVAGTQVFVVFEKSIVKRDKMYLHAKEAFVVGIFPVRMKDGSVGMAINVDQTIANVHLNCNCISELVEDGPVYKAIRSKLSNLTLI